MKCPNHLPGYVNFQLVVSVSVSVSVSLLFSPKTILSYTSRMNSSDEKSDIGHEDNFIPNPKELDGVPRRIHKHRMLFDSRFFDMF